ncbi:hypothetical protein LCGC14_2940120, partial [marine sediment metagenome]
SGQPKEEVTSEQLLDEAADKALEEDTAEPLVPAPEDLLRQEQESAEAAKADQTVSPARQAFAETTPEMDNVVEAGKVFPDRQPKQPPSGDLGSGSPLSDMQGRDKSDQTAVARDLLEEPDIGEREGEEEVEIDKSGQEE